MEDFKEEIKNIPFDLSDLLCIGILISFACLLAFIEFLDKFIGFLYYFIAR